MLRKILSSIGLVALWVSGPILMFGAVTQIVRQSPPVVLAGDQGVSDHSWDDFGYVYARGTWVMENEEIGSPFNDASISCYRGIMKCMASTAEIVKTSDGQNLLVNSLDSFDIDRWSADTIVYSNANGCTRYTVTISRASKSVTARREPDPDGSAAACMGMAVERDAVLRTSLQDGSRVYARIQKEASQKQTPWLLGLLGLWSALCVLWVYAVWRRKTASVA